MEKTYPVELVGYRRLGDNGASLTLHSCLELDSDDIKYLDEHRGNQCLLLVTSVAAGLDMPDIDIDHIKASMVENTVYDKDITPSERQRRDLYVLYTKKFGREPSKSEMEEWYLKSMDDIHDMLVKRIATYDA
jgi:hypothetical protein